MAKWIEFEEIDTDATRKTKIFEVITKEGRLGLGIVKWHGAWRKYCFFPAEQTIYEWDCLRDIAEFCQSETKKYKETWCKR
jgi:hypothetical protein